MKMALEVVPGMKLEDIHYIVGTGYGRVRVPFANRAITEIACHARGANFMYGPKVRTVMDMGGQDLKAISCDEQGKVLNFIMNEKCAAGSGAFVEAMARAMQLSLDEFASFSLQSTKSIPINAQCAIFAESEVVSLVHEETDRADICKAVHDAIAARIASMARRIRIEEKVALIGGVAKNKGFLDSLKRELKVEFIVPADPDFVGALGAALLAG